MVSCQPSFATQHLYGSLKSEQTNKKQVTHVLSRWDNETTSCGGEIDPPIGQMTSILSDWGIQTTGQKGGEGQIYLTPANLE